MRQLVICCLISVLLLTFYLREGEGGPIHAVRGGVSVVTMPVRMVGSVVAAPFGAIGNAAANLTASEATLSDLKKENEELTARVAELSEAESTAERLQELMGLQSTYNLTSTAARIIGSSGDSWSQAVILDKGSKDGIATGMPVMNAGGVIGQVVEVSPTTSTVQLIGDERSGVSAMVQSSRAQGMLQGQSDGTLRLSYVTADAEVKTGDIVVTSGLGGVYPKGLPLGTVSSVDKADNATYYTIVVRPASTVENNEEVLVVTSLGSDQAASDADVASANASSSDSTADAATKEEGSASTDASAATDTQQGGE